MGGPSEVIDGMIRELFHKWLLFVSCMIAACLLSHYYGLFSLIEATDKTYLTFIILGLTWIATLSIGYKLWSSKDQEYSYLNEINFSNELYCSGALTRLGLIGTVIGFILMLPLFAHIDFENVKTMQDIVVDMTSRMGTALWTTFAGILGQLVVTFQLQMINNAITVK
jgi:hypothetical protein